MAGLGHIYDLKGSLRGRYIPVSSGGPLLDENMLEALRTGEGAILVRGPERARLERALHGDVAFLASQGIMDYSLLCRRDGANAHLVVGVVDYLRAYTWDKQMETWVKSSGLLGGGGLTPTVISPNEYMQRFMLAMGVYFSSVPGDGDDSDAEDR